MGCIGERMPGEEVVTQQKQDQQCVERPQALGISPGDIEIVENHHKQNCCQRPEFDQPGGAEKESKPDEELLFQQQEARPKKKKCQVEVFPGSSTPPMRKIAMASRIKEI